MKFQLMLRHLESFGLAALCAALPWPSAGAEGTTSTAPATNAALELEWVITQVLSNNPSLKAARANADAMETRIRQARAWEDPVIGVDLERSSTQFDDLHNTEWMISQELPLSGKNRQRAKIATSEAGAAVTEVHGRRLELIARARIAFFRYAKAYAQIEINRRSELILRQFADMSRDKYALGRRSQADVFMAETELARLLEQVRETERELSLSQSQLNTLMFRPAPEPLPAPAAVLYQESAFDLSNLQAMALENRPEIEVIRKQIDGARAQLSLAKRAWFPDPELRVEARQFNGGGGKFQEYDTGVFFKFPWLNQGKYKGAIAEARKQSESAEQTLAALQSETMGMVRDQWTQIETLRHHYHIYRDRIEPLARQAIEASRIAYVADQGTILELLTAQRSHRDAESMMQHHLTEYLTALTELDRMIGRPATNIIESPEPPQKP